jgi:L-fucose isomerase-like protein
MSQPVILVASGDLRLSANQQCWPAQQRMEAAVMAAIRKEGYEVVRGHDVDPVEGHGFIKSQIQGIEIFRKIPKDAPVVVAEAVWQYSHHVLPGLLTHKGPILTVANWSGEYPGLVGMLNLNAGLTKAGVKYTTLWSEDFTDQYFQSRLRNWLKGKPVRHDTSHAVKLSSFKLPPAAEQTGAALAQELLADKAIMGIFDEGCMGMYNAIIQDELLFKIGICKERLSQSTLYAAMLTVPDAEAQEVRNWLDAKGMKFVTGPNPETDLTDDQILDQCKMYISAVRLADQFGCSLIGIQYQQGLKDLVPASDLVEGLLNNVDRPPVKDAQGRVLFEGKAIPHFNEVDECAGVDALITNRVWTKLGFAPETTLHDVRYGEDFQLDGKKEFIWVYEISGAVPPAHLPGGYAGASSERQPPMFFKKGGGTIKGVCKAGEIVWSRVFVDNGKLKVDIGRGRAVELPKEETDRLWKITNPEWPMMHAITYGVSRNQFMARHKSNHIQVAYAPDAESANMALATKAAMFRELGVEVSICGTNHGL